VLQLEISLLSTLGGLGLVAALSIPVSAQWIHVPEKLTPHTPDGKVNMSARVARIDGKPDLSGIWEVDSPKYFSNLAADIKPDEMPFQPWAAKVYAERRDTLGKEDPEARCFPAGLPKLDTAPNTPFRIAQMAGRVDVLYERDQTFRQIFTDGRAFPVDPQPAFMGYSVGKWEGATLVVEVKGFNDVAWLDDDGHPHTDALQLTERYNRADFGHMTIDITVNDPKAYTKAWTAHVPLHILPDTELIEYFCSENNKDVQHMYGK
jgi:hypothetical protein